MKARQKNEKNFVFFKKSLNFYINIYLYMKKIIDLLKKYANNDLIKNTLLLTILSLFVKGFSLINRIILTRMLGVEGIGLYVLSVPSIMLFITLGGLGLNITLSKIVSENQVTKKYSQKTILKKAITIGLCSSIIAILILLVIINPLTQYLLKNDDAFYPILATIILIPISAIDNIFKGYYNGINKISITALGCFIEEITRILFSILFLYLCLPYGIVAGVTASVIAMAIGELFSLIILIIKVKSNIEVSFVNNNPTKEILDNAFPTISSRILGNITYFFEPIIYTLTLSILKYTSSEISYNYTMVNAYVIPIITMLSFFSNSIGTVIIPNISKNNVKNNTNLVIYYIKKSIVISLLPGILLSTILSFYGKDLLMFIYNTDIGAKEIETFSYFFILFYISFPLTSIYQALGLSKLHLKIQIISSITKLLLIFSLAFVPQIKTYSLLLALLINSTLFTMIYYYYLKNKYQFHFSLSYKIKLLITSITTLAFMYYLSTNNLHFIIASIIISAFFGCLIILLNLTSVDDK